MANLTFHEIECRSALRPVRLRALPRARWGLDPYRERRPGANFDDAPYSRARIAAPGSESRIVVRTNLVEVLRRELRRPGWKRELVVLGAASDPYPAAEMKYGLTRRALQALRDSASPCAVLTRSPHVLRDLSVLRELSAADECHVLVTMPTLREDICRHIEPGGADPALRLDAVSRLVAAGVRCTVMLAPVITGLTDDEAGAEALALAARDRGAGFVANGAVAREASNARSLPALHRTPAVQLQLAI